MYHDCRKKTLLYEGELQSFRNDDNNNKQSNS